MNLDKAIELAKESVQSLKKAKFHDHADAIQILIKAGKYRQSVKEAGYIDEDDLLPGETKEG